MSQDNGRSGGPPRGHSDLQVIPGEDLLNDAILWTTSGPKYWIARQGTQNVNNPLSLQRASGINKKEKNRSSRKLESEVNLKRVCLSLDVQLVESVTEHFKKWGPLMNVKVLKDWMQRPYSFVQFERIEDAQRAMAEAQNTVIDGRHIRIEQARVNRTLFILRFGRNTTEQEITEVLEQYGPVEDVSVFHDLGPARSKRYAFAKFAYRDDAIRAYMALRSNSKWTVEWAPNLSSQSQIEKESVFVGQLNPELTTEADLHDRFQDYGTVQHIHLVKRNKPGTRPTAFAFIEFDDEYSARQAIEHENNTSFLGSTIRVQHREASEYRLQRQNAAIQAARSLNMPHTGGPPPVGMPTPPVHTPAYSGVYQPYRGYGIGRPMYYTTYYTYPAPGMPIAGSGFIPRPQPGAVFVQPGAGTRGPPVNLDGNQGYYPGATTYSSQVAHQCNATDQYGPTQEVGPGHQGYDYNAYIQSPEGMYYPPPMPGRVYMYDHASAGSTVTPVNPGTAAGHTTSTVASINPMWHSSSRLSGGSTARVGPDALNPHMNYTLSQGRSSDATPSTAGPPSPHEVRNQTRKSA
ncbi:hypothetical protein BGZ65_001948 [Modicella reniformis]|uniref:RRM domain-containing protein n=1 Tax=Modicella reniformis TaxID=1440133 RepID=A0A9P6ILN0_9FUNG|nr:hypothetical protein BGZ65_001948 [Modicella reniformis]